VFAFLTLRKKNLLSFSILYFFITVSIVCNFVVDAGTPFSERFMFQPSLAFCIALSFLYLKFAENYKVPTTTIFISVLVLFSAKTLIRNTAWKDNDTLMITDVSSCPNSLRTNGFAMKAFLKKAMSETDQKIKNDYFSKAAKCGEKAIEILGKNKDMLMDLGNAYLGLSDYFKSADCFWEAYQLNPTNPEAKKRVEMLSDLIYNEGNKQFRSNNITKAIEYYKKSVELNNTNVDAWYNLGGSYFKNNETKNGIDAWQQVMKLSPNHTFNKEEF
jgi:tetratricopeptide (TPR) repeat protein